jgi:hypothetical protein
MLIAITNRSMKLDTKTYEALNRLLPYCYDAEAKHYQESGHPRDHIFRDVMVLAHFLTANTPPRIFVEPESNYAELTGRTKGWLVTFEEGEGRSTLSRQKTKREAERRASYFRKELAAGRLLREDPSVWQ